MNTEATDGQANEQSLIQLYMNLTGTTEAHARSVFMYLNSPREELPLESAPSLEPVERLRANGTLMQ